LVQALDYKPILGSEMCPIIAENGSTTGLAAYFGLAGVEVCIKAMSLICPCCE
jgi:hypothetical protein